LKGSPRLLISCVTTQRNRVRKKGKLNCREKPIERIGGRFVKADSTFGDPL